MGLGAVLMQEEQPIAYFSQVLGTQARQKSTYEMELMAICVSREEMEAVFVGKAFRGS